MENLWSSVPRKPGHDDGLLSKGRPRQADDLMGLADVEVSFVERQPVRLTESGYDDIWIPVSCSICIQIKTYNLSGGRTCGIQAVIRTQLEHPYA